MATADPTERYAELYPQVYRLLGRRLQRDVQRVTPQGWGVLQHLELTGPQRWCGRPNPRTRETAQQR